MLVYYYKNKVTPYNIIFDWQFWILIVSEFSYMIITILIFATSFVILSGFNNKKHERVMNYSFSSKL
jgi:hypothetical protein